MNGRLRLAFMGSPDFAVPALRALAAAHDIVAVYAQPPKPAGRGQKQTPCPVHAAALALGLPVRNPARLRRDAQELAHFRALGLDAAVVAAYGLILPAPMLRAPRRGCLNIHASLLPRWRGAAPIQAAILAGDAETGVSIMRVTAGLDSGPVYLQGHEPIRGEDTYGTLAPRLERLGGELLFRVLDEPPQPRRQDDAQATYAEKITAEDRLLDPSGSARELERVTRALAPHIGARLKLADGTLLGVREVRVRDRGPAPGTLSLDSGRPVWGCARGALELLTVHPPGRRAMSGEEYVRGLRR
jgi:methionyl-tRNA formyltransferase